MKTEVKLWKEYKKHIAKLNKPIIKGNSEAYERYSEESTKAIERLSKRSIWDRYMPMEIVIPPFIWPLYKETYEGFLDWQLNKKK